MLFNENINKDTKQGNESKVGQEKRVMPEYTVSQISQLIKGLLETNFSDIHVKGEISEITHAKSGHVYFTIKDEASVLSVICWQHVFRKLQINLDIGLEVLCRGKVSSYPPRSNYQFILTDIKISGDGTLLKLFEERKQKLQKMGIFDSAHKLQIPQYPQNICVITSESGAVIKDIIHRIKDRYPTNIFLYHCQVQGATAHIEIIRAIRNLNKISAKEMQKGVEKRLMNPDLIIIARGGGSAQDLWPFNEEEVALAVYNSKIPIISAVGHETDFTLCDFAADLRAPTPSAAAELATPKKEEIIRHQNNIFARMRDNLAGNIKLHTHFINDLRASFIAKLHDIEIKLSELNQFSVILRQNFYKKLEMYGSRVATVKPSVISQ